MIGGRNFCKGCNIIAYIDTASHFQLKFRKTRRQQKRLLSVASDICFELGGGMAKSQEVGVPSEQMQMLKKRKLEELSRHLSSIGFSREFRNCGSKEKAGVMDKAGQGDDTLPSQRLPDTSTNNTKQPVQHLTKCPHNSCSIVCLLWG